MLEKNLRASVFIFKQPILVKVQTRAPVKIMLKIQNHAHGSQYEHSINYGLQKLSFAIFVQKVMHKQIFMHTSPEFLLSSKLVIKCIFSNQNWFQEYNQNWFPEYYQQWAHTSVVMRARMTQIHRKNLFITHNASRGGQMKSCNTSVVNSVIITIKMKMKTPNPNNNTTGHTCIIKCRTSHNALL